jgi:hypothetical protein
MILHKFHVALHAPHAALPILTSKFHPKKAPPHFKIKISPYAALPIFLLYFNIPIE